jgi:hypothetical protein
MLRRDCSDLIASRAFVIDNKKTKSSGFVAIFHVVPLSPVFIGRKGKDSSGSFDLFPTVRTISNSKNVVCLFCRDSSSVRFKCGIRSEPSHLVIDATGTRECCWCCSWRSAVAFRRRQRRPRSPSSVHRRSG